MLAQDIAADLRLEHRFARAACHARAQRGRGGLDHAVERERFKAAAEARAESFRLRGKGRGGVIRVAVESNNFRELCDLLRCAPALKGEEHIRPHKEQQLAVGVLPAQGAECIDGIALALARHLEVEHLYLDAALKRGLSAHEARHGETVLVRGTSLLHHLVWRDARRNEQELIQRALLRRLDGGVLVPQMRRVEAAAVNSDLQ